MSLRKDPVSWLYPAIEPTKVHRLKVSKLHELYVEESGNPDGKPVVFLHGGPGGGTSPKHRRFFDPERYHIILFDQRGCGQNTPYAEVRENTTWDLVADIECIRQFLGIERWMVFGGSWGATLGLAYAETHPQRVTELLLRGIFLLRQREVDWLYQEGASRVFPDAWEPYRDAIPEAERGDFLQAYAARLLSDATALSALPGAIIQGRYDMVCPIESAWALSKAWPGAEVVIVPDAGHSAYEPGISKALVAATDRFAYPTP